jgi:hypothetical protein
MQFLHHVKALRSRFNMFMPMFGFAHEALILVKPVVSKLYPKQT